MTRITRAALRLAWLLAAASLSGPPMARPPAPAPLTAIRDVRIFLQAQSHDERVIEVRGVVTYFDADARVIYLQDATGALAFEVSDPGSPVTVGQSVRLSGSLEPDSTVPRALHPHRAVLASVSSPSGPLTRTPVSDWPPSSDLSLTRKDLDARWDALGRSPLPFETSHPGLFAVGDVRSGSTKRVAAAVGEGSAAVRSVHAYLAFDRRA